MPRDIVYPDPLPKQFSTLVELIRFRSLHQADQTAYTFLIDGENEEVSITYRQLDLLARTIAASIQKRTATGERALLLYPSGLEYIAALFGCLYAGVIAVPVYPPKRKRSFYRLHAMATDAQATLVLTTARIISETQQWIDQIPELTSLRWLATDNLGEDVKPEYWQQPDLTGTSPSYIQYTSGSTSFPKGVVLTHNNLLSNLALLQFGLGTGSQSTGVSWLPLYHDMGLIGGILHFLFIGRPLVFMSPTAFIERPVRWLRAITRYQATISGAPNFAYQLCLERISPDDRAMLDLTSWEVAVCGAEPVQTNTLEKFAQVYAPCGFRKGTFYPSYGLAEATLMVSGGLGPTTLKHCHVNRSAILEHRVVEIDQEDDDRQTFVSCGRALLDQKIVIVDPETLTTSPPDRVGEIWVSGPSVAQGYWNQPEKTEKTFQAYLADSGDGPYLRTGDLGFLQDGELFITGRIKDIIIIRGRNYYPQDLEQAAGECHPALQSGGGAAFSITAANEERLVIVHEVKRRYRSAALGLVVEAIRGAIADDLDLPVYGVVLIKPGHLPRTSSGKIQRSLCRSIFLSGDLEAITTSFLDHDYSDQPRVGLKDMSASPPSPIEEVLNDIWCEILELQRVGSYDNFFALGGNSLKSAQVISRIRELFSVELPLRCMFDSPTVVALAGRVEQAIREGWTVQAPPILPASRTEPLPLSFSQERLWIINQLDPDNSAYNIPNAIRLEGPLCIDALEESFNLLVQRHEILRTTFERFEEQLVQVIAPGLKIPLPVIDLRGLPKARREEKLQRLMEKEAKRPFDVICGPLIRVSLFYLDDEEYILLLNMHHIVSDAWSLGVIAREIMGSYEAITAGRAAELPDLPIQYADFAAWQRKWLRGEVLEAQLSYWRKRLAGVKVLELPADRPRPAFQTYRGSQQFIPLSGSLIENLRVLSRQEGVTLFMTMLSAFKILLYRYTGQDDLAVGVPVANRRWMAIENLVGPLVNTLVIRTQLSASLTFRELLGRIREATLGATANQDLPFDKLVAEINPNRDTSHLPLVQVMFNLINVPIPELKLPKLTSTVVEVDRRGAQFDLTLTVIDINQTKSAQIDFNIDLFDSETIARMLGHFQTLLESIASNPGQQIATLPILTSGEKHRLLHSWNDTRTYYPDEQCIHRLFEVQVERTPAAVAVIFNHNWLTFRELNRKANQLARYLQRLGVGPQTLVGISMTRSLEMVVGLLAILKAGGAYLPLDPINPRERLAFMVEDSKVPLILTQQSHVSELPENGARLVCVDADWEMISKEGGENLNCPAAPEDVAYVIYTSGSTGFPKGVVASHGGAINRFRWMWDTYPFTKRDIACQKTNLSFVDSVWEVFGPLLQGVRNVIIPDEVVRDPYRLIPYVADHRVTRIVLVPSLLRSILDAFPDLQHKLPHLQLCISSGEILPLELSQRFHAVMPHCTLLNLYGSSEVAADSTWYQTQPIEPRFSIPIGRPISNTRIYILDENLQPVPVGVPGDLYIGGAGLARGYLNRPQLTAEKFVSAPFSDEPGARIYKTGDLARYLPDGNIEYIGRRDNQVKIRGFRIDLEEVESVLEEHDEVQQAVVTPQENGLGDKRLVAYIIPLQDNRIATSELREFLRRKLPEYMIPSAFVFMTSFPLTPSGKIDRRSLPAPSQLNQDIDGAIVAPRDDLETELVQIWEDVLEVKPIGIHNDFFELGGHSLLAILLISKINQRFEKNLPLASVFSSPTVEQMASRIRQDNDPGGWSPVVPIKTGGSKPPFFCIHGFGGGVLDYGELAHLLGGEYPFYGIQAKGVDGSDGAHDHIEEMAEYYIDAIREVQPVGPYYLGGYCFGGVVAYEMACQFVAQGEEVAFLGIFEGYAPVRTNYRSMWNPQNAGNFFKNVPFWLNDYLDLGYEHMLARIRRKISNARKKLSNFGGVPVQIKLEDVLDDASYLPEDRRNLLETHLRAHMSYLPPTYKGRITLFRVKGLSLFRSFDPLMGWGKLATGGVNIRIIEGAHYNIFMSPHVNSLADQLWDCLDNAYRQNDTERNATKTSMVSQK